MGSTCLLSTNKIPRFWGFFGLAPHLIKPATLAPFHFLIWTLDSDPWCEHFGSICHLSTNKTAWFPIVEFIWSWTLGNVKPTPLSKSKARMTRTYSPHHALEVGPWNWIVCGTACKKCRQRLFIVWWEYIRTKKSERHISRKNSRFANTRWAAWIRGAQAYGGLGGLHFPRRIPPLKPYPTLPYPLPPAPILQIVVRWSSYIGHLWITSFWGPLGPLETDFT